MSALFGRDPVEAEVEEVLGLLAASPVRLPGMERKHVDLKEEAGRRERTGELRPAQRQNETAARQLAAEAACMANTPGGGALIVGVADDGTVIGTDLDAEWLRRRIYDLTQRLLTVDVRAVPLRGHRIMVVRSPQAIEPIRWNDRINWRVGDRCVEVDATTWHSSRMTLIGYDWSDQSSQVPTAQVSGRALSLAREFLRDSGESSAADLAAATDADLLRRLNVIAADGSLTNAGALAFVGRREPTLDYLRRDVAGGDSITRVRSGERSLLEAVAEVDEEFRRYNRTRHVRRGLVVGRVPDLPELTVREAIVNGVVHRDWANQEPTVVEHIGRSLVVTSPGGFYGGVTPNNIITHPSQTRNRSLASLFSALRLAEREGIGVDRMVRDMISLGYPAPDILEVPGPFVRTALVGEPLDEAWIRFLTRLRPDRARDDLRVLLLLRQLVSRWWIDVSTAAPLLQVAEAEAAAAVNGLLQVTVGDEPLIEPVIGIPAGAPDAWRISSSARQSLADEDASLGWSRREPSRPEIALSWARARGRVSSTELAAIIGAKSSNVGGVLRRLEEAGQLRPSREVRRGAGFYYLPVAESGA